MQRFFYGVMIGLVLVSCALAQPAGVSETFEADQLPAGWTAAGDATIDAAEGFQDGKSLRLRRELKDADAAVHVVTTPFEVTPGIWQITFAARSAMESPDTSYAGVVDLEIFDAAGKRIDHRILLELSGDANWKPVSRRVEFPASAATAGFKFRLEKAIGSFHVDNLAARFVSAAPRRDDRINRVLFVAPQPTGLLYPDDPRTFRLQVETTRPLDAEQLEATCVVRDYWGAEQLPPVKVKLAQQPQPGEKGRTVYAGRFDAGAAPLELGKYYELHAAIPQPGQEPYTEFSSFAILPEAAANQYKVDEVPFSGRSWDNRSRDHVVLSHRLGIRIIGLRTPWTAEPPAAGEMPHAELVEQMDATWMARSPNFIVEQRAKGYEKFTEQALRAMVRDYAAKYKRDFPTYISLGNEPHGDLERVRANIASYKATYEAFKKLIPNMVCIGTAVGPAEEYFQEGFGAYCDVYDYHTYGGHQAHRRLMARYRELFKKYGHEKPVWVTELGLNAQGMSRHAIAQEVPKHFAVAFAEGVANASWFGTCFPDPEGKIEGSNGDSFNLFRGKYRVFAPRMDAIAYYNTINSIANKKFVEEKSYGDISAFLFRNADGKACQILWKDKGRADVDVPLAGVGKVKLVTLDGRWSEADAGRKGVSITVNEDPVFLEYESTAGLTEKLPDPAVKVTEVPPMVVKGKTFQLALSGDGEVSAPPFWTVARQSPGVFQVTPPAASSVREGTLVVKVPNGELNLRLPVSGQIVSRLLPVAATPDRPAAVRLVVRNIGSTGQNVGWKLSLEDQAPAINGTYDKSFPATAYFAEAAEGSLRVEPNSTQEVLVSIDGADPLVRYHIKATLKDGEGRTMTHDRFVAGFAAVPKTHAAPKIDGVIDDADWGRSAVHRIHKAEQYNSFKKPNSKWDNPADLSAKVRFLWDDRHLYIAAEVADDVYRNSHAAESLWSGDGLQLLVDVAREATEKPGKYDYVIAQGTKGPQAWCALSADPAATVGEAKDIQVATRRTDAGGVTYEFAIPWARLAPFKPTAGANLGLALGVNEDDGEGRNGLMSWFGNVHSKQLDSVGDLILTD